MASEDGQVQTPVVPDAPAGGEAAPSAEPVDIAAAFQLVREQGKEAAEPAVEEGGGVEEPADAGSSPEPAGGGTAPAADEPPVTPEPAGDGGGGDAGGPVPAEPAYDYDAGRQGILESLNAQAQSNVVKMFRDNNVRIMNIQDLYERREDGTVVFNNPDDPSRPFASRAEAQGWINSMNTQINQAFRSEVMKEQQNLMQQAQPAMRLLEFAPAYDAMEQGVKDIFDELVEPYGIRNARGQVVGFNCNLAAMAQQATRLASRFGAQAPQPQAAQPAKLASQPAMDIKTSGGSTADDREPKSIQEAWMMLNKSRKEKANGK